MYILYALVMVKLRLQGKIRMASMFGGFTLKMFPFYVKKKKRKQAYLGKINILLVEEYLNIYNKWVDGRNRNSIRFL